MRLNTHGPASYHEPCDAKLSDNDKYLFLLLVFGYRFYTTTCLHIYSEN